MNRIKSKIRKRYSTLRSSLQPPVDRPLRLVVEKARWYGNAASPVVLMIDDLANAWHSREGKDTWDRGGDWGGGHDGEGSVARFIKDNLLDVFPELHVTFFTVAGRISHYTEGHPFTFAEPMNFDEESRNFFRALNDNDRIELAYHGYDHGTPGRTLDDFVQEWMRFSSVKEACEQTEKGLKIFEDVLGARPLGGKYGGWSYNDLADESIDRSGFSWWCRDWMPRDTSGVVMDGYYEPRFFGENLVVALPTTVHGFHWQKAQLDRLIERGQIISIEEHIAPVRPDGLVQSPNVYDDISELQGIYRYLRGKDVWHATCSEVAEYFTAYSRSLVYDMKKDGFRIEYDGRPAAPLLTIIIDASAICDPASPYIDVTLPGGGSPRPEDFVFDEKRYRHMVTIPVLPGEYKVTARARRDG